MEEIKEKEKLLLEVQKLWKEIRKEKNRKSNNKKEGLKNRLREKLEKLIEIKEVPIYPREILKEIAGEDWKKLYWMIDDNWGINEVFFRKIWKKKGGSPIKIKIGKQKDFYVFEHFPEVYLSATGVKPDVAFFPRVISPDNEMVGELTAIILFKGNGQIIKKKGKFVNQINVVGREELVFQVRELISKIFGVSKEFSKVYSLKSSKKKKRISVNSLMIGTYFQNLIGIFEVEEGSVFLRAPYEIGLNFKKGFVKGVIEWKGRKVSQKILKIRTSWRRKIALEIFRKYTLELEDELKIKTSRISPVLKNQMKILITKNSFGSERKIIGKTESMIPAGKWAKIFSRDKSEVGVVAEIQREGLEIEIEKRNFELPLFAEREYQLIVRKVK